MSVAKQTRVSSISNMSHLFPKVTLVIFGQPTMASYEWLLIFDGNISHSNDGFGSIDAALIKGLKVFLSHMEGDEK